MKRYLIIGALLACSLTGCELTDLVPPKTAPLPQLSDGTLTIHTVPEGAAILLGTEEYPNPYLLEDYRRVLNWRLVGYSPVNVPVKLGYPGGYLYGTYYFRAIPTGAGQYVQQWKMHYGVPDPITIYMYNP
jgi:hypothetical protein